MRTICKMTNTHRALSSQMWVYNVIIICCKCCKYDGDQKSEEEKCVKSLWHSFKVAPVIVAFFQSGTGKIIKNDFIIVALNQWEHIGVKVGARRGGGRLR